jgi:branched-chain amino acid transport system ATP-binding protein
MIEFDGRDITRWSGHRVRRSGVVHLPEGRGVFRRLSVLDNLKMASAQLPTSRERREAVSLALDIFPALAPRSRKAAGLLSGGEQQMLSLARALAVSPKLIVADEMSLGLAPIMVDLVFGSLERARDLGVTIVLIEQYIHRAIAFSDRCIVLQRGEIAWSGWAEHAAQDVPHQYFGDGMVAAV